MLQTLKSSLDDFKTNIIFKSCLSALGSLLHEQFETRSKNVRQTQLDLLENILSTQKNTAFGIDHDFSGIKTVLDYRARVRLHTYDDLKPYMDRILKGEDNILVREPITHYATTSGTTGEMKFIPVTAKLQKESHQNVARHFTYTILKEFPKAYDGKILAIVSPAEEGIAPDGKPFGSTSGMLIKNLGRTFSKKYALPFEVLEIEDYETRYFVILVLSIVQDVTLVSTANPSTLLLLAKKINEKKDELFDALNSGTLPSWLRLSDNQRAVIMERHSSVPKKVEFFKSLIVADSENLLRPKAIWLNLVLVSCWKGGNCAAYVSQLLPWFGDLPIKDLGYLATELRAGVNLDSTSASGALTISENFFEFIKVEDLENPEPNFYLADELEIGQQYSIYFTTKGGLYRYNINDIIEVTEMHNELPCIRFVQKGKGVTSLTGEKLYEQQLMDAVSKTNKELDVTLEFYLCHANLRESRYDFYADFGALGLSSETKIAFGLTLDSHLKKINSEYKSKRDSMRLKPLQLNILQTNSYATFKKWRVAQGVREGQYKVTPLTQDENFLTPLFVIEEVNYEPSVQIG